MGLAARSAVLLLLPWFAADAVAQTASGITDGLQFRNLGPFRAGAWVTDIAVPDAPERDHRYTLWVGTRTGGVWKSTNNGTTFTPVFDEQGVLPIGAVAVAPTNADVVYVGTGDPASARSSYAGDGVYRTTDGGRTWQHVGLRDSHHIARIIVHPRDPDVVWVAALGHLYSRNEERGVYRTADGGRTWERVLYTGPTVGAVDLVMSPDDPDLLYAAMYDKERFPWHLEEGGPGSGIYRSRDGGRTWARLEGGLPSGNIGRIGLDIFRANPRILYAVVENVNPRPAAPGAAPGGRGAGPQRRVVGGEVYRSENGGDTWRKMNRADDNVGGKAAYSFNLIRVDPRDDQRVYITSDALLGSTDGGRTWTGLTYGDRAVMRSMFGDFRALWVDPLDGDRIIAGTDGGVAISYDGGRTADHLMNLPLGENYAVAVDMEDPYNIYAGLQDHESWKGPVNGWSGSVGIEDWITVGTGDGMYNAVDPTDSRWLYNTLQFGDHHRVDQVLGTRTRIAPSRPQGEPRLRFTWVAPLVLSPHDPATLYAGAQVLLRSTDRGDSWTEISPDLTTNDPAKQNGRGNIQYTTIATISESPRARGVIWVGTDDGRVQLTRDGGGSWTDVSPALEAAGMPEGYWVTRVFASPHADGTAFVTVSGYSWDDFRPFVFRTTDFGRTWATLSAGLPQAPVNVIVQDPRSPGLLFTGTDRGVWFSLDAGASWAELRTPDMPAGMIVRDLLVHPREADLVVATYGRGLWVGDVHALQQMTPAVLARDAFLFEVEPKGLRVESGWGNYDLFGDRLVRTPNEPNAIAFNYHLARRAAGAPRLVVRDATGTTIRTLAGSPDAGLHRVTWDFRDGSRRTIEPGTYEVVLEVDGTSTSRPVVVRPPVHMRRSD